jgi:hypothetical protein
MAPKSRWQPLTLVFACAFASVLSLRSYGDGGSQPSATISIPGGAIGDIGAAVPVATQPTTQSATVSCDKPNVPPEAEVTGTTYTCSVSSTQYRPTTQASWGSFPAGAAATVAPTGASTDPNFTVSTTMPAPGYYKISLSGSAVYTLSDGDPPITCPTSQPATFSYTAFNYTYAAGDPITVTYQAPTPKFSVSPGEKMIFDIQAKDVDQKQFNPDGEPTAFNGTGPYEMDWSCSPDAEFDSSGSNVNTKQTNGLAPGNVYIFTKQTWTGQQPILVELNIKDLAPDPVGSPDTGTTQDEPLMIQWTISLRGTPPTNITTVGGGPNGAWLPSIAHYTYLVGPTTAPAYAGQSVLESFSAVTANGFFTMSDLTNTWKAAHPAATTPDEAAAIIWPDSGNNSTFTIDQLDQIYDQNGGFGDTSPFTYAALQAGIGNRIIQTFSAGNNVLGQYTIDTKYTAGTITVDKNGP